MLIAIVVIAGAALLGLYRIALWAERRGWAYYHTRRVPPPAEALAIKEMTAIPQPAVEHVIEETRTRRVVGDWSHSGEESP